MSDNELGPLVRLWGLRTQQLPSISTEDNAVGLESFVDAVLKEAVPFIDSAAPKTTSSTSSQWKSKGANSHSDSSAKIDVKERVVPVKDLERVAASPSYNDAQKKDDKATDLKPKAVSEYWCCRLSVHEDAAKQGTASWDEFERYFRLEHAESEKAFTPAVLDAYEAIRWDCSRVEPREVGGVVWGEFGLVVEEMRHKVGRPVLKDRTFPVLQMTAKAIRPSSEQDGDAEFVVVSIPIPDFGEASEQAKLAKEKGPQVAIYASVERLRKLDDGRIEWLMATTSDAKGVLPTWVQNKALPAIVWKDVPLFLAWAAKERSKGTGKREGGGVSSSAPAPAPAAVAGGSEQPGRDSGLPEAENPQVSTGVDVGEAPATTTATTAPIGETRS